MNAHVNSHIFGYLILVNRQEVVKPATTPPQLDLWRINPRYTIGRFPSNDIDLPGSKISNYHCVLQWNGEESEDSVTITDLGSTNGTYLNGIRISSGVSEVLKDGDKISLGGEEGIDAYDFTYAHAVVPPSEDSSIIDTTYNISFDRELGERSDVGKVYLASHRMSGTIYAVKRIITPERDQTGHALHEESPAIEAAVLERLEHRNIVDLVEVFVSRDKTIDIVLEYIDGGSLCSLIESKGVPFEDIVVKHIIFQLCDALTYMHSMGVIHCNLRPENILLTSDIPPVVKLGGFGLARFANQRSKGSIRSGGCSRSPEYMAPEIFSECAGAPHPNYTYLADSWSLGVIMLNMMTGYRPFLKEIHPYKLADRSINWDYIQSSFEVTHPAYSLLRGLLEIDPVYRLSTVDVVMHDWLQDYFPAYGYSDELKRLMAENDGSEPGSESSESEIGIE